MTCEWEIFLFAGTNPADKITLRSRRGSLELRRSAKKKIKPAWSKTIDKNIDAALDGFFDLSPFSIDRANGACRTPRRNRDVERALGYFTGVSTWCRRVGRYLSSM